MAPTMNRIIERGDEFSPTPTSGVPSFVFTKRTVSPSVRVEIVAVFPDAIAFSPIWYLTVYPDGTLVS